MVPTPLIPNGVYKIRNGQSTKLAADLLRGDPYGLIIAAEDRPPYQFNQVRVIRNGGRYSLLRQWRITNEGNGGNQVTIQNEITGTFAFAPEDQVRALADSDRMMLVSRRGIDHDLIVCFTLWLR